MANAINRLLTPVVLAGLIAGCATSTAMRNGRQAEQLQDYDRAIVEYTKVLRSQPDNREARQLLDRARVRAAADHFSRGRRLEGGGRLDEALVELQLAAELNPNSQDIRDALESVRTQQRNKVAIARDGKTGLESLIERTRNMTPQGQELPNDVRLPASLTFRDAPSRDVFTAIARFANINVTFDPQFRDQPVTIDLRETTLENALQALSASTRSFYRITGPRFITVVPDTAAKRQEYEEEIVRTFPLSNADLKETVDLLRIVIDARRLAPVTATNTIAIKDTPARVAAAGRGDRRRAARNRSHQVEGIRTAACVADSDRHQRADRHQRRRGYQSAELHAARSPQSHAVRRRPHQSSSTLLQIVEARRQHADPR